MTTSRASINDPSSLSAQKDARQISLNFSGASILSSEAFTRFLLDDSAQTWQPKDRNKDPNHVSLAITLALLLSQTSQVGDYFSTSKFLVPGPMSYNFTNVEYGYGYGTRSTSIYLAMTVMTMYCAIIISYILYSIAAGSVSTAWGSGVELFALALQSRKPDHLGHTSVGIDSIKPFSEGVGIRVNQDDELEIVFANDRDFGTRGLRKINKNREY
ncbi:hypothetical protein E8E13_002302 [Curvularia kusanoi]|uniref:Uncharacterized protein n=1 Tax=Curvularia kusanoi TaxID=90978 RepID=A0A9P4T4Y6_CURKU|nr:hypothetical protein E8E13_002302 [Curvularia kusanoi]